MSESKILVIAAALTCAVTGGFFLGLQGCSGAQKQRQALQGIDSVCAMRAQMKDAGVLVVTDGCPPDASDAHFLCVGK